MNCHGQLMPREKTKPAVYYLGLNGVRYLRMLTRTSEDEDGETTAVTVYLPEELRKRYKEPTRSQTYIDRCILIAECCLALERVDTENETKSELIQPSLVFCKDKLNDKGKEEETLESYIFEILFVCPRTTDLIYAKRRTRKLIADAWEWKDEEERPRVRFTTVEKLKQSSVLSKEIWEEAWAR